MINAALADALKKRGYKIGTNTGNEKKTRISRAQQRAKEREEQQALAVQQAELEVKEKRDELGTLDKEIAELEQEVAAMEKAPSPRRPVAPQVPRQGIDFDRLTQGMNNLKEQVKMDRMKQKEPRQRSQAPQPEHDRPERDGIDI